MARTFDTDAIAETMRESREFTRAMFDLVIAESDLRRPPADGFRPILWHLGHVGAFESYWILQRIKGDPTFAPRYDVVFDPIKTPREDASNLPPIAEIESYLARVREEVLQFMQAIKDDHRHPLLRDGYIFNLVIEHEYQHQETLAYLLQMLAPELKAGGRRQEAVSSKQGCDSEELPLASCLLPPDEDLLPDMVYVPGGPFEMGSRGYPFAYDNEQPPHMVELDGFRMDRYPVTNGEYAEFIAAGGYAIRSLWSDAGWEWKEKHAVAAPLYWSRKSGDAPWQVREMFSEAELRADHPVAGVSWHEAMAYARFVGKRLPTEAEWEKAASWNAASQTKRCFSWGDDAASPRVANYNFVNWETTPVALHSAGASAYGCVDMSGNVWEWTATVFEGYPGFEAYPYTEYSELWFDGDHRVLKGGSWATRLPLMRCSFRNFWRPGFRIAFAGFRCTADA
ncbi:MAG: gamma-glutamyl hercynylcysteine S-oxide synthase [Blastocatellia bacterium]